MSAAERPEAAASVKACCAALYGGEWATFLLGDSFHPGGLRLTERLGGLLDSPRCSNGAITVAREGI